MPASVSCGTAQSVPPRVNCCTTDGSHADAAFGPRRFPDVDETATVGVSGEVGVGDPEDVVGATAGDVGAQRGEVGRVRHDVGAHVDVGMRSGERRERLSVSGSDLLVPQPDGDDRLAGGRSRRDVQDHRREAQQRGDQHEAQREQRGEPRPDHLSPVTTIERTMCRWNTTNSTSSGTIATTVAAITNVHCEL